MTDPVAGPDDELDLKARFPGMGEIVGALACVAPFFVHVGSSSSSSVTVNGQVVESAVTAIDYVAIAGGAVALLMALIGFARLGAAPRSIKMKRLAASGAIALVGAFQLFRGLGKI